MEQDPLDRLLESYSKAPPGSTYSRTDADVWREIDRRKARLNWFQRFMATCQGALAEPRFAMAALTLAVGIGIAPTLLVDRAAPRTAFARHSLHLDVFSATSPAFRAALLRAPARAGQ